MNRNFARATLGLASASCAAALCFAAWPGRSSSASAGLVDNFESARAIVDERLADSSQVLAAERAGAVLAREVIPEVVARDFFAQFADNSIEYHSSSYYRHKADQTLRVRRADLPGGGYVLRTNGLGLREDGNAPLTPERSWWLATGDSHTDGVCENASSWPNQLEARLRARGLAELEIANAGVGGYSYYHYLGALEAHLDRRPRRFLVCSYAGNDFVEVLRLWCYFERLPLPELGKQKRQQMLRAGGEFSQTLAQCLTQAFYFSERPQDEALALEAALRVSEEIGRVCAAQGIELCFALLPCVPDVQAERYAQELEQVCGELGLDRADLAVSARLGSAWLEGLEARGLETVDLRPAFRAATEDLYWHADFHINVAGHALVAEVLDQALEAR